MKLQLVKMLQPARSRKLAGGAAAAVEVLNRLFGKKKKYV